MGSEEERECAHDAFVAILEMHGKGTFFDSRLNDATMFPIAAKAGVGNVRNSPDLVTSKLAALQYYQLSIPSPPPPAGSFDAATAKRGEALFRRRRQVRDVPRAADLHGARLEHVKGGFFHDGRFATLLDVVNHYHGLLGLKLGEKQKTDLVEYLKSL